MKFLCLLACLVVAATRPVPALEPNDLLSFCLDNPDRCAFSINHLTEGWERHWNADRLQVTASTFKILSLIAYAEAVVAGRIEPDGSIDLDDWARFWIGRDGGALSAAWNRLGQPQNVTVDEIVHAMIRESDNAAPDWLLNELGERALKRVVGRFVEGFHDVPESISAMFTTWDGNPTEPTIGQRILNDYSGLEVTGHQRETDAAFEQLQDPGFVHELRDFTCIALPWNTPPAPPCTPGFAASGAELVELTDRYFMRSTTRTYNRLMAGLLEGDLLRPHWTTYMESRATGDRVVVSIFLHRLDSGFASSDDLALFAETVLFDPDFRTTVQAMVRDDIPTPERVPRITKFKLDQKQNGDTLAMTVEVINVGTEVANGPFTVSLFLSDNNQLDAGDLEISTKRFRRIAPTRRSDWRLVARELPAVEGKYAIVLVDASNAVAESVENDNVAWQIIQSAP